ncbi:MAG: hypothetical protein MI744_13475, partial [Pseudomonadales bacterium]|nr:hypothetical protein [Pseudomonadales bacterium]
MPNDPYNGNNDPYDQEQMEANQRRAVLLNLLRGRWHWAVLLAVVLATVGGYLGYNSQEDVYNARSYIDFKYDYSNIPINITDLSLYEPYVNFVNGERRKLKSLEVIENAFSQPEWQEHLSSRPDHLDEVTISDFAGSIDVSSPDKNETIVFVSVDNEHPATARAGLNSLLEAYRELQRQETTDQYGESLRMLTDRKAELEKERAGIDAQIKQALPDESADGLRTRRQIFETLLTNFEFELNEIDLILKPFHNLRENADPATIQELMLQDPKMVELLESKEAIEQRLVTMREVYGWGEENRAVQQERRRLALIDRDIAELEDEWSRDPAQLVEERLPARIEEIMAKRQVILEKVEELNAKVADLTTKLNSVAALERRRADNKESITSTEDKIRNFKASQELLAQENISRIEIGPPAATPTEPWNADKRKQMAGVGAIAGFFLGFGLVMAVGLMDRRLRHVEDTTAGLPDTNVLGILPTLPASLKDPEDAETAAHCVHHIRTLLQIGGSNRVFSITSPAAGSGKSSLATALGMSFAASGVRTLVIDCDLVGAGLSRRMGTVVHEPLDAVIRRHNLLDQADLAGALTQATASARPLDQLLLEQGLMGQDQLDTAIRLQRDTALGVLDACSPSRLRSCVAATDVDNFFILPVGRAKPSDASKLSPAAIRELVRQAREAFDIVLIDTGPVLGSLEASIAAAEADATI